jgi:hypothetical protein
MDFVDGDRGTIASDEWTHSQRVLRQAVGTHRPSHERWTVIMRAVTPRSSAVVVAFALGTEQGHSFTFDLAGDDADHSGLYRAACRMLLSQWKGTTRPS